MRAITVTSGTITVGGLGNNGIDVSTTTGAITVNATNTATGSLDAIYLGSTSGNATVNLADGGTTSSGGAGVDVNTGGTATVNVGASANTAVVAGGYAGLFIAATGGTTITNLGTVGSANNLAVQTSGGAATLTNKGVINGYVTLGSSGNTVNNQGTWNFFGGDSSFTGASVVNNSGTLTVAKGAATATTLTLTGLTTLNNSGTISIDNGHTGDVLNTGGSAFVGSGSSKLVLDANLGATAVGASAPQTSNTLVTGAASGATTIVVKDLSGTQPGQYNFTGIRLVTDTSATPGAFVLANGPIVKGFVQYQLAQDLAGNWDLVGVPSTTSFEVVRTGVEAQKYWRLSADTWAEQMRNQVTKPGLSAWLQVYGGGETDKSSLTYNTTVLGKATSFNPNLDLRNSWEGLQAGFEKGYGYAAVGLTVGYADQSGRVNSTSEKIKLNGGNVGLYARYESPNGFFLNGLAKYDFYTVSYVLAAPASTPNYNGTSYGLDVNAGYHATSGNLFFDPEVGLSWSHTKLDGYSGVGGQMALAFNHLESAYLHAGAKVGLITHSNGWTVKPYVGAAYEDELNGQPGVVIGSGVNNLAFADSAEGGHAKIEAGIQGISAKGLSVFAKVEGTTGKNAEGISGRAGIALHW